LLSRLNTERKPRQVKLKKIVPKKLNPEGKARLPIMNTARDG